MAESVAGQQSSIDRHRPSPDTGYFFVFPPPVSLNPAAADLRCDSLPPGEIDALVDTAAERASISPQLIRSVMQQESSFRVCAVSAKGALGLMQLLPATASQLGVTNAFDPQANVLGGATLLKQLMERYGGDLSLTLSAYNAGPGRVDAATGVPMIPETIEFVRKILSRLSPELSGITAEARENADSDDQAGLVSAPSISLRLTGAEGGK
jgi:soluble lytic murein transglycosylase-like protein